jgi:DNA-binding Lrp family transcriptional regulator
VIQANSRQSVQELGNEVGLSGSACHRRLKALEDNGLIDRYKAVLNAKKVGFQIMLFVQVSLLSQSEETLVAFEKAVLNIPEILDCYLMAGDLDFLLRVACRDHEDFERLHRRLLSRLPGVAKLHTNMSIRTLKSDAIIPV